VRQSRLKIASFRYSRGVIAMGDHQDRPVLATLLEALIASALIGTFVVYGYPHSNQIPGPNPGEVAGLAVPR